jgi:transcription termination factor NusB
MIQKHNTIKARIRARKLTLSYFYWRIFVFRLARNEALLETIINTSRGLEDVHDTSDDNMSHEMTDLAQYLTHTFGDSIEEDIDYVVSYYFDEWAIDTIDMDYVLSLSRNFEEYYPHVASMVNKHTTSFQFEQMDPMDQAMFVLGYEERKLIQTPKEVIINEVVELAKRYGDG